VDSADGFVVAQPSFSGTLGELAHALRSGALAPVELDLYQLVRSYLAYFQPVAERNLDLATEALPKVAQVIELKVRLLLPRPPKDAEASEEELLEHTLDAVALLEELEDAIRYLRHRRQERRVMMPVRAPKPEFPRRKRPITATAGQLATLAARMRPSSYFELSVDRLTLASAMKGLMDRLRSLGSGRLFDLYEARDWPTRTVVFTGMLELVKQGDVVAQQDAPFAPIGVERRVAGDESAQRDVA
jgi:segregation and condensation protein A